MRSDTFLQLIINKVMENSTDIYSQSKDACEKQKAAHFGCNMSLCNIDDASVSDCAYYKPYKEKKEQIKNFRIGVNDRHGSKITSIYNRTSKYIIYEIEDKDIANSLSLSIAECEKVKNMDDSLNMRLNCVRDEFISAQGVMNKLLPDSISTFKTRLAGLIAKALETKCNSNEMRAIEKSIEEITEKVNEDYQYQWKSKLKFSFCSAIVCILAVSIATGMIYWNSQYKIDSTMNTYIPIILLSCIGGFISISIKMRKVIFPRDFSDTMIFLFSLERMFLAVLSGTVAVIAVKSGMILNGNISSIYLYILLAVIAGFGEQFVPNLLTSIGKKITEEK